MIGILPDLGDCHGRLRLPRNDRNVLRNPPEQKDKLQFITPKKFWESIVHLLVFWYNNEKSYKLDVH